MNDTTKQMKTTLQVFCESVGWQGGTIHQAWEHFNKAPTIEQDSICGALMDQFSNISDYKTARDFTSQRVRNAGLVIKGISV